MSATEFHVVVICKGPDKPVMLTIYGSDGEDCATAALSPRQALTLAQKLLTLGIAGLTA